MQNKVLINFAKMRDAVMESKGQQIFTALTNNPHFPGIGPRLAELQSANKVFSDAMALASNGDRVKVSAKNDARKALVAVLNAIAREVNFTSSDRTVLLGTGFNVSVESKSTRLLGAPTNFTVLPGMNTGEMIMNVDPVAGASSYVFMFGLSPVVNNTWSHSISTVSSIKIDMLQAMKLYDFRIGISGPRGQLVYTAIITKPVS